jgi:hypothetical protein
MKIIIDVFALVLLTILMFGILINNTPIVRLGGEFAHILLDVLVWFLIVMIIGVIIFIIIRCISIILNKLFGKKDKFDF